MDARASQPVAKSVSEEWHWDSMEREEEEGGGSKEGAEKNRLLQKGSPRSLLSLEIIIAPLTVARLRPFSTVSLSLPVSFASTLVPRSHPPVALQNVDFILR